jgi:hypothetical protein
VAIHDKSCVITMPRDNTTFRLTSVKPFYKTDKLIKAKTPEPKRSGEDVYKDVIIVNITNNAIPTPPLKHGRGRPRKNPDVTLFLQEDL